MKIIKCVSILQQYLDSIPKYKVGFIPTMGALHDGHLSLVKESLAQTDVTVVSIFINPSQFDEEKDLEAYPKTLDKDIVILEKVGIDILFAPDVDEIYPKGLNVEVGVDLNGIDKVLEGKFRPGHFKGMLEVVNRLLDIVRPDMLFMGQKDIQQWAIIKCMLNEQKSKIELVRCSTQREDSGLALSSRNERLSEEERINAAHIYETLDWVQRNIYKGISKTGIDKVLIKSKMKLFSYGINVEYLELVNSNTFQPVEGGGEVRGTILVVAAYIGGVRLIDNIIIK